MQTVIEGGAAVNDVMQQSSTAPSGTLVGMQQGNVTLYGCAIDPEGSRTCGTVTTTVRPPGANFNASAALSTVDVSALIEVRLAAGFACEPLVLHMRPVV